MKRLLFVVLLAPTLAGCASLAEVWSRVLGGVRSRQRMHALDYAADAGLPVRVAAARAADVPSLADLPAEPVMKGVLAYTLGLLIASAAGSAVLFAAPGVSEGQVPDFHLLLEKCKIAVGYHVLANDSLKVIDGDPVYNACTRRSKRISCALGFPSGGLGVKGQTAEYIVVFDSPPYLHFTDEKYADYFAVNLTTHAVVLTTRFLSEKSLGSKVCHGLFATDDEMKEALNQKR
jgi:hypothetical protein